MRTEEVKGIAVRVVMVETRASREKPEEPWFLQVWRPGGLPGGGGQCERAIPSLALR